MARKKLTPTRSRLEQDPDYYLHGRERRERRAAWEWPDAERHPDIGIVRYPYADAWRAQICAKERIFKCFSDRQYGGREAALEAAIAWRKEQIKRIPGHKPRGWKLSPDKAGNIILDDQGGKVVAALAHDGAKCRQAFSYRKYGKDFAIHLAEMALEIWREEALRISKMSRSQQERIAAKGGWTARRGFPRSREQMDLPLDG